MTRLRNLVDRAYALDPRIKRQKREEQQRKDDEKLRRKQEIDKRRQEQKQKEIDEAKRIAEERQRLEEETKRKQDEAKREQEAHKKLMKYVNIQSFLSRTMIPNSDDISVVMQLHLISRLKYRIIQKNSQLRNTFYAPKVIPCSNYPINKNEVYIPSAEESNEFGSNELVIRR